QVVGKFADFPIIVETFRECLDDVLEMPRVREFLDAIARGEIRVETRRGEIASPFASDLVFQFTAAYLYEWDEPRRNVARPARPAVDEALLDGLLQGCHAGRGLDEASVGRVEPRLRQRAHPPRSIEEMAEALRTLGDLAPSELVGPMERFVDELAEAGRAVRIELTGVDEPGRWILGEEAGLYESAFRMKKLASGGREPPVRGVGLGQDRGLTPPARQPFGELETIVRRYLRTHALVGLSDLIRRYPIAPEV